MNYLAHGRAYLDRPFMLAGTAVPDWLGAVARKSRIRSQRAAGFVGHPDARIAELAQGIVQHHADDAWFHQTPAFVDLSMRFTTEVRGRLPADDRFRPGFLGHILVELLLDAHLAESSPHLLADYYRSLAELDAAWLEATINHMAPRPTDRLAWLVDLFRRERFLEDYRSDAGLFFRLNQVMLRVGLEPLPDPVAKALPICRQAVYARASELLPASR